MRQKDMYTLDELYANLDISLSKLSKIAGVTEPTLTRIRDGYSARVETVNKILKAFSQVYGLELSRDNVTGIILEDKKAIRRQMLERQGIAEKDEKQPVPVPVVQHTSPQKRAYKPRDTDFPGGCILASKFAEEHNVKRPTFIDHMNIGLGPGLIHGPGVPEDGTVLVKDYVRAEERNKRVRKDGTIEKERFLTSEQQADAITFWKRHDVEYSQCDNPDCPCHQ